MPTAKGAEEEPAGRTATRACHFVSETLIALSTSTAGRRWSHTCAELAIKAPGARPAGCPLGRSLKFPVARTARARDQRRIRRCLPDHHLKLLPRTSDGFVGGARKVLRGQSRDASITGSLCAQRLIWRAIILTKHVCTSPRFNASSCDSTTVNGLSVGDGCAASCMPAASDAWNTSASAMSICIAYHTNRQQK